MIEKIENLLTEDLINSLWGNSVFTKEECKIVGGYYRENLLDFSTLNIPFFYDGEWNIEEIESHFNKWEEGEEIAPNVFYKD